MNNQDYCINLPLELVVDVDMFTYVLEVCGVLPVQIRT